jgi:hypothetical protein
MKVKRLYALAVLLAAALPLGSLPLAQAEPTVAAASPAKSATPTTEEVRLRRHAVRRELMYPSLKGIRGLAYGTVEGNNAVELQTAMLQQLKHLDIPLFEFKTLKSGVKPVDGLLEIKIVKVPSANYVQLNLIQWVSLLRQPKAEVRAITYHDSMISEDENLKKSVTQLTEQFVVDVLKANQASGPSPQAKEPVHKKRS